MAPRRAFRLGVGGTRCDKVAMESPSPTSGAAPRPWYRPTLTRQILIGLVIGCVVGWWMSRLPVATKAASGQIHGTACFCIFEPINARLASSCSKNGIIEVAME